MLNQVILNLVSFLSKVYKLTTLHQLYTNSTPRLFTRQIYYYIILFLLDKMYRCRVCRVKTRFNIKMRKLIPPLFLRKTQNQLFTLHLFIFSSKVYTPK